MRFRLSDLQLQKLSDIVADVGIVSLASVVLPAVLDKFDVAMAVVGLLVATVMWLTSLWVLAKL